MENYVLQGLLFRRMELQQQRAELDRQRAEFDAELTRLERSILLHEAIARAATLGIKISDKTYRKAVAWGTITIMLERHGPLTTAEIKNLLDDGMDAKHYTTLRSHLFRMDLAGIIHQDESKRWRLEASH